MKNEPQSDRFGDIPTEERTMDFGQTKPLQAPLKDGRVVKPSSGSGCGCWLMGCAGVAIGFVLLIVAVSVGGYWFLTNQVEKYTSAEPDQIPIVETSEEELAELQQRIESFSTQLEPDQDGAGPNGQPSEPNADNQPPLELVLTADQINALIQSNDDLRGRAHVVIADGRIQAKVSIPADQVPGGKGRFFNADAEVEVSLRDDKLNVRLVAAKVQDQPLPDAFTAELAKENLAKDVQNDPRTAELLSRFESIEVVDDAIHLRLKQPEAEKLGDPEVPAEAEQAEQEEQIEAPLPMESDR